MQFKDYLERAEFIKGILDGQLPAETSTANGSVGQKARPTGGGGDKDVRHTCKLLREAFTLISHRSEMVLGAPLGRACAPDQAPVCAGWLHRTQRRTS